MLLPTHTSQHTTTTAWQVRYKQNHVAEINSKQKQ